MLIKVVCAILVNGKYTLKDKCFHGSQVPEVNTVHLCLDFLLLKVRAPDKYFINTQSYI